MPTIETKVMTGETWQVGDYEITPQTWMCKVQVPGYHAGIIWNRPKAVIVRTADGQEQILPIHDMTRRLIWAMLLGGIAGAIMIGLMNHKR